MSFQRLCSDICDKLIQLQVIVTRQTEAVTYLNNELMRLCNDICDKLIQLQVTRQTEAVTYLHANISSKKQQLSCHIIAEPIQDTVKTNYTQK